MEQTSLHLTRTKRKFIFPFINIVKNTISHSHHIHTDQLYRYMNSNSKYCTKKCFPLRIFVKKIYTKLQIWSYLLQKFLMENFIFCSKKSIKRKKIMKNCAPEDPLTIWYINPSRNSTTRKVQNIERSKIGS